MILESILVLVPSVTPNKSRRPDDFFPDFEIHIHCIAIVTAHCPL